MSAQYPHYILLRFSAQNTRFVLMAAVDSVASSLKKGGGFLEWEELADHPPPGLVRRNRGMSAAAVGVVQAE